MDKLYNKVLYVAGIVSIICLSAGLEFHDLTSWTLFFDVIKNICSSPAQLIFTILAILGYLNNPSTSGFLNGIGWTTPKEIK